MVIKFSLSGRLNCHNDLWISFHHLLSDLFQTWAQSWWLTCWCETSWGPNRTPCFWTCRTWRSTTVGRPATKSNKPTRTMELPFLPLTWWTCGGTSMRTRLLLWPNNAGQVVIGLVVYSPSPPVEQWGVLNLDIQWPFHSSLCFILVGHQWGSQHLAGDFWEGGTWVEISMYMWKMMYTVWTYRWL